MSATTRAAINLVNNSCLPTPTCNFNSKYRTIDGSCNSNNSALANLGKSSTDYRRLVNPAYNDGYLNYSFIPKKNLLIQLFKYV